MRKSFAMLSAILFSCLCFSQVDKGNAAANNAPPTKADTSKPAAAKKVGIAEKVKSSKKTDGLFTLYQDTATGSLQLYVKKDQLNKDYIYESFSINGPTSLLLNQSMHRANLVFKFVKAFDKLEMTNVNTQFVYDKESPMSKTAGVDVPESVILSEKITAEDADGYLVNADGLFL